MLGRGRLRGEREKGQEGGGAGVDGVAALAGTPASICPFLFVFSVMSECRARVACKKPFPVSVFDRCLREETEGARRGRRGERERGRPADYLPKRVLPGLSAPARPATRPSPDKRKQCNAKGGVTACWAECGRERRPSPLCAPLSPSLSFSLSPSLTLTSPPQQRKKKKTAFSQTCSLPQTSCTGSRPGPCGRRTRRT